MTIFTKERFQELSGIPKKDNTNGDMATGVFVMKSPFTPKGWKYDHIGFVLDNGKLKDMSGHRYDETGKHPMPPVTYSFKETEELFNMPADEDEATRLGLFMKKELPNPIHVPNHVVCNIQDPEIAAVNCGSFVKIVLSNNGIETTDSDRPDEIFNSIRVLH